MIEKYLRYDSVYIDVTFRNKIKYKPLQKGYIMIPQKTQKTRKLSRIKSQTRNLWFYSNEDGLNQSNPVNTASRRTDLRNVFNDEYTRYGQGYTGFSGKKSDCTFVVDWQMTETI